LAEGKRGKGHGDDKRRSRDGECLKRNRGFESISRYGLTEYRAFGSRKAEIQIRSILQHAWAEIEHDLGYQRKIAVPAEVRRRFSRIAGILELVDQEFIGLRDDIVGYSETIKDKIANTPEYVGINKDSIAVYLFNSPIARRIDSAISEILGIQLIDRQVSSFYETLVKKL
jgi:putative GTP pyrophosphokinase